MNTQDANLSASATVPPSHPPQSPALKKMREVMSQLSKPIYARMDKLELLLAGFSADDVAKDILQLQRRLMWQPADLWSLLANERAAIGDAEGADKSRKEGRALMDHWGEELSADAPSDALEMLNRLQATRARPLHVEQVTRSFSEVSANEKNETVRESLREYGLVFGEHARPVVAKMAEASIQSSAGAVSLAGLLLKEAHLMLEAISIEMAYPVAHMWCDLAYVCKDLGDIEKAAAFADDAYRLLPMKWFGRRADALLEELVEAKNALQDADAGTGEVDEEAMEATQKRIDELRAE